MIYRASLVLLFMAFYSTMLNAEEENMEDLPYVDFIEFLGEWQTEDGEWIDPIELEKDTYAELEKAEPEQTVEDDDDKKSE